MVTHSIIVQNGAHQHSLVNVEGAHGMPPLSKDLLEVNDCAGRGNPYSSVV